MDIQKSPNAPQGRGRSAGELESPFGIEELFFSVTDGKGVISAFNDVFVRVSEYAEDELHGKPHNIIRHPDVPRAVFRLLWEFLFAGRSIAAYVKNRSRTGKYYWVLAFVCPVPAGYLSIRLKPSSELHGQVSSLYAAMLKAEHEKAASGGGSREVMDCSTEVLTSALQSLGFKDYEAFMWHALITEMQSRQGQLEAAAQRRGHAAERSEVHGASSSMLARSIDADAALTSMFKQIGVLNESIEAFRKVRASVSSLSRNVHRLALNASLQATGLGEQGRAVSTLANFLGSGSRELLGHVDRLTADAEEMMPRVLRLMFDIAIAKLQIEMVADFLAESRSSAADDSHGAGQEHEHGAEEGYGGDERISILLEAFSTNSRGLTDALHDVRARFGDICRSVEQVMRCSKQLSFIHVTGRVEAGRLPPHCTFGQILESVSGHLVSADAQLRSFIEQCNAALDSLRSCERPAATVHEYLADVHNASAAAESAAVANARPMQLARAA